MQFARSGSFYQLRLERGEDIPTAVTDFVRRQRIRSGVISGIGAAERVVLGYFDQGSRSYRKRSFPGQYEIAALVGNVGWDGPNPICHMHAVISDARMVTRGGHLFEARVTVTCEVTIVTGTRKLRREPDPATGLKLLLLPESA
jgi:predicted DNA-binding protein with PD1-like motif